MTSALTFTKVSAPPPEHLNPYEDWDSRSLPQVPETVKRWHPVYVAMAAERGAQSRGLRPAAEMLHRVLRENADHLKAPLNTVLLLQNILESDAADAKALDADTAPLALLYRWEPEGRDRLYHPLTKDSAALLQVVQVGPAIPTTLDADLPAASPLSTPIATQRSRDVRGKVLTAVIDDEIGFLNARFRQSPTKTRIQRFWSMAPEDVSSSGGAVTYGKVMTGAQIDELLQRLEKGESEAALYAEYDVRLVDRDQVPVQRARFRDPNFRRPRALVDSHGTAVLDLAAGRAMDEVADEDPILAVELPQLATAETNGARLESYILEAVGQVLAWADTIETQKDENGATVCVPLPLVINLSLGIHAGPKDGTGFVEAELKRLVEARNRIVPTKLVQPAGNSYLSRGRAAAHVPAGEILELDWRVEPDDASDSFLEIYAPHAPGGTLSLTVPGRKPPQHIPTGAAAVYLLGDADKVPFAAVYVQPKEGMCRIVLALAPTRPTGRADRPSAPSGCYGLGLHAADPMEVAIETQRDDTPAGYRTGARQSYLDAPDAYGYDMQTKTYDTPDASALLTREGTLSAYATAVSDHILVVGGAYGKHSSPTPKSAPYSSAGQENWPARKAPTLSAVSEAARVHSGRRATGLYSGSTAIFRGTSLAAPVVTRAVVKLLKTLSGNPTATELAHALVDPAQKTGERARLGLGILDEPAAIPARP